MSRCDRAKRSNSAISSPAVCRSRAGSPIAWTTKRRSSSDLPRANPFTFASSRIGFAGDALVDDESPVDQDFALFVSNVQTEAGVLELEPDVLRCDGPLRVALSDAGCAEREVSRCR